MAVVTLYNIVFLALILSPIFLESAPSKITSWSVLCVHLYYKQTIIFSHNKTILQSAFHSFALFYCCFL